MPTLIDTDRSLEHGEEFVFQGEYWRVGDPDQDVIAGGQILRRAFPLFSKGGMICNSPIKFYVRYHEVKNVTSH